MDEKNPSLVSRVRNFFSKTGEKLKKSRPGKSDKFTPGVNSEGLLSEEEENSRNEQGNISSPMVRPVPREQKNEQLEKLQNGFNRLNDQLQTINGNLTQQLDHQQKLIEHLDKLPQVFESLGPSIKSQQQLTEQMVTELQNAATKNQMFVEAVEKIPTETAKQTDALQSIDHQLAAAADCDAQMTQSFAKFRQSMEKLDQSTTSQTDSIMQMSKTFAASDRYLKYIISRDKKRMFWLFVISLGICVAVILALVGIILYLGR